MNQRGDARAAGDRRQGTKPTMAGEIRVLTGPARSGKTGRLVDAYRQVLSENHPATARWIAPDTHTLAEIRQRLVRAPFDACLAPGLTTFERLAQQLVRGAADPPRLVSPWQRRQLLRRTVVRLREAGELPYFARTAARDGFVQLLYDLVLELTRQAIDAGTFARFGAMRGQPQRHRELALIYAEYEKLLSDHRLSDNERLVAHAAQLLVADAASLARRPALLVVDGFTDFNRSQMSLFSALAARAERTLIALPADEPEDPRPDLFARPQQTLAMLRHRFPQLKVEHLAGKETDWVARDHITRHLFRIPRQVPPPPAGMAESLDRLEIVAAASADDELREIATRIKRLLVTGQAAPDDVAVVFRSLQGHAERVLEVFAEFGIPLALDARRPLFRAPAVRALVDLLRLDAEDWPFRRLLSVVCNRLLTSLAEDARGAAEWLVRELQFASGRRPLVHRVRNLAEEAAQDADGPPVDRGERLIEAARGGLPVFELLEQALDQLPQVAPVADWIVALDELMTRLGLDHSESFDDRNAWRTVVRVLSSLEPLDAWTAQPPTELSRDDLLRSLVDLAAHETLPPETSDVGRVRVREATAARGLAVRHLFVAGMSELAFPSPERVGRLYGDDDLRAFALAADQLAVDDGPPITHAQGEMLLFYEVINRATETLTLSYPALDDKAQLLPPSPYLTEIERVVGEEVAIPRSEPQLRPVPATDVVLSPRQWRLAAVDRALAGEYEWLAGLLAEPVGASIVAALGAAHLRTRGDTFGPQEGVFASDAARQQLAGRFGEDHLWSPSQLETYGTCPFQFFMRHVLRAQPLGELALETNYGRRGTLLHDALARLHAAQAGQDEPLSRALDREQFLEQFAATLDQLVYQAAEGTFEAALAEIDRRQLHEWAAAYYEQHVEYESHYAGPAALRPAHFEIRFGPPRGHTDEQDEDPCSTDEPLVLEIDGVAIRITGRIDRVDVGQVGEQAVFNVVDYKTGNPKQLGEVTRESVESGRQLQLPLYVMAAEMVLKSAGAVPWRAGYWAIKGKGFDRKKVTEISVEHEGNVQPSDQWQEVSAALKARLVDMVRDIQLGRFPMANEDLQCARYCDYSQVCRVAHARAIGKQWPPPESTP